MVDELKASGEPITFLGVAKAAGVSDWLAYAKGVREHIKAARTSQHGVQRPKPAVRRLGQRGESGGRPGVGLRRAAADDTVAALRQSLKQMMRDQSI